MGNQGLVRSSTWRKEELEIMEKHAAMENASIKDIMRELDNLILFPKPLFREREAVKTMFYRVKAKLEKDRRMRAVDDLQKEIFDEIGSLDKVNEKIALEQDSVVESLFGGAETIGVGDLVENFLDLASDKFASKFLYVFLPSMKDEFNKNK
jgi:hypothetical protein